MMEVDSGPVGLGVLGLWKKGHGIKLEGEREILQQAAGLLSG